jgi:hypothetical protein
MFFQLLYIHLFRPFLKYSQATSPLPPNISPRRLCTQAAQAISKLLRLYKRSHGLRQICNIAVYIAHSACTIHLLNLPDKNAKRDITHGVKHLEEIAESWLCARRTLAILSVLSRQWKVELPEEAAAVFTRTNIKFAAYNYDIQSRVPRSSTSPPITSPKHPVQPSPNFFIPPTIDSGASTDVNIMPSPTALPPQNASELGRYTARTSPPDRRTSMGTTDGSPSAIFGDESIFRSDSSEWWMNDQRQLAFGFEQWPAESLEAHSVPQSAAAWIAAANGNMGSPPSSMATPPTRNGSEDDATLLRYFPGATTSGANVANIWGAGTAMHYPNEAEWYQ